MLEERDATKKEWRTYPEKIRVLGVGCPLDLAVGRDDFDFEDVVQTGSPHA
jgi:hypothetical protein